jgi:hypothetical protein
MPPYNQSDLGRIYEGAKELFLLGKHERAIERFLRVYEIDVTFYDVAEIVNDYYDMAEDKWVAKYESKFRSQPAA